MAEGFGLGLSDQRARRTSARHRRERLTEERLLSFIKSHVHAEVDAKIKDLVRTRFCEHFPVSTQFSSRMKVPAHDDAHAPSSVHSIMRRAPRHSQSSDASLHDILLLDPPVMLGRTSAALQPQELCTSSLSPNCQAPLDSKQAIFSPREIPQEMRIQGINQLKTPHAPECGAPCQSVSRPLVHKFPLTPAFRCALEPDHPQEMWDCRHVPECRAPRESQGSAVSLDIGEQFGFMEGFAVDEAQEMKIVTTGVLEPSFFAAAAHYALRPGSSIVKRVAWFLASFMLIVFQCACMIAISVAVLQPSCRSNESCTDGTFCAAEEVQVERHTFRNRCVPCSLAETISATQNSTGFCEINPRHNLCIDEGCYDPVQYGISWNPSSAASIAGDNVTKMTPSDFAALLLAAMMIAIQVGKESVDIVVCELIVKGSGQKFLLRSIMLIPTMLRQCLLLPMLAISAVFCVIHLGSSALEICFNTLAVLFMLQFDDYIFVYLLDQETKMEVEDSDSLVMHPSLLQSLERVKLAHVFFYSIGIASAVCATPVIGFYAIRDANFVLGSVVMLLVKILIGTRCDNAQSCLQNSCASFALPLLVTYLTLVAFVIAKLFLG